MRTINNLREAEEALAAYIPQMHQLLGKDITLQRMRSLMQKLDNPQDKLKIIHIAGTSGKTSTSYYISSLLLQSGQKVGLTVSPHIDSVTERLQIDSRPLEEKEFCRALTEFLERIKDFRPMPTYFELLIAMAYWYFAKIKVGYAVIETGLGGLHDATNIAAKPNKVCVITDIGYDHTHVLGETLIEIAKQKAGIIHPSNTVLMHHQTKEVEAVFKQKCREVEAPLKIIASAEALKSDLPLFQQRNWTLALAAHTFINQRDGLSALTPEQLQKAQSVKIPGRMDTSKIGNKVLIMDGAHNQQKIRAFVKSFQAKYPGQQAAILLSLKKDKDYQAVIPELLPIAAEVIITSFEMAQDLPANSMDSEVLAEQFRDFGFDKLRIILDQHQAYQALSQTSQDVLVITGSFYLISQIRSSVFGTR